jgi:hypothetical protein
VSLERGPVSLVRINEELLERNSVGSFLEESKLTVVRDPLRCPRGTLHPQKLALKFADQWRSLSRYSSLGAKSHGVVLLCNGYDVCMNRGHYFSFMMLYLLSVDTRVRNWPNKDGDMGSKGF